MSEIRPVAGKNVDPLAYGAWEFCGTCGYDSANQLCSNSFHVCLCGDCGVLRRVEGRYASMIRGRILALDCGHYRKATS